MKYRELLNNITEVAKKHPNINSTFIGDVYELNHRNDVDYCAFVITNGTHRVNSDETIDYSLNLFYVDRLTADEGNRTMIHSAGIDFMNSLLRAVEKLGVTVVEHTENVFNERFNDVCAGVYATVVFRCEIDECGQTIEIITPDELKIIRIDHNGIYDGMFKRVEVDVPEKPTFDMTQLNGIRFNSKETTIDLTGLDTSSFTTTDQMFSKCTSLTSLDLSSLDTSNVTYMYGMFWYVTSLASINLSGLKTSKVTDMSSMFQGCSSLISLDLSGFDTSNVTRVGSMFESCESLATLNLSGWNTSNVTYMGRMFHSCKALASLDLPHFNVSNVTGVESMFESCETLATLNLSGWNTSNVTDMSRMFYYCKALATLDLSGWNTGSEANMQDMFQGCKKLKTLNISNWNMNKVTNVDGMFYYCYALETITCDGLQLPDIDMSNIQLGYCDLLTYDSLLGLINALPQSDKGYSFQIGQTNIEKLSDWDKSIAITKGWKLI